MNTTELLASLRKQGVRLWIEEDRLRFSAPVGVLCAETKAVLASRKQEILALLRRAEDITSLPPAIVPLKMAGSRPPLFAFPGYNGDVFCWIHLARYLDADQPLLAVQPPGLDGSEPLRTIEELGRHAVDQIRRTRADGPYLLAGYCAGGTIAFEVARQLNQQGQHVAFVALFDTPFTRANRFVPAAVKWMRDIADRARTQSKLLASMTVRSGLGHVAGRIRQARLTYLMARERRLATSMNTRRLQAATSAAIQRFQPRMFGGMIDLFSASDSTGKRGPSYDGWQEFSAAVREHVGPDGCHHDVMLREPWVAVVAALLNQRLDEIAVEVGQSSREPVI